MSDPKSTEKFRRFEKTEILLHWAHGLPFIILLLCGFWLAFQGWMGWERSSFWSDAHKIGGVVLIFLPAVVVISGNLDLILNNVKQIRSFGERDISWMKAQRSGKEPMPQGKFNMGQKINSILVMSYSTLLQLTGIWLWLAPQGLLPRWLHTAVAFGATFLLSGHIFMATLNPSTKKAFKAVITGFVARDYILHHHPLQLEDQDDKGSPKKQSVKLP